MLIKAIILNKDCCIKSFLFLLFFFSLVEVKGQVDSTWSVLILKRDKKPEMKDNMSDFSQTGFYLYKNCVYDFELKNGDRQTLRLVEIKKDTLLFSALPITNDKDVIAKKTDTVSYPYSQVKKIFLIKDWGSGSSRKIDCADYYFIFQKTTLDFNLDSRYADVFGQQEAKRELFPRLTAHGVTYNFEYQGKLYYHSGMKVKTPRYSDEQKRQALNGISALLDLLINKRVNITVREIRQ